MERENQISKWLMVVGVLFIVIAGSIFVMTAWQYLPEFVKQLVLLAVAIASFTGSHAVSKKADRETTETALFYLGTAFSGFFLLSILGGVTWGDLQMNALKVLLADLVMGIAIACRTWKTKKALDFSIFAILMDGILGCICFLLKLRYEGFILLLGIFVLLYAIGNYYIRKENVKDSQLGVSFMVFYLIHAGFYSVLVGGTIWFINGAFWGFKSLSVLILVIITGLGHKGSGQSIMRVLNSMAIFWLTLEVLLEINQMFYLTERSATLFFAGFVVNLVIMICLCRKEMFYIQLAVSLLVAVFTPSFQQLFGDLKQIYYPYSFVMAFALILYMVRRGHESEAELWGKRLLELAGLQTVTGILLYVTWKWEILYSFNFFGVLAIIMLTAAVFMNDSYEKRGFITFALILATLGMVIQSGSWHYSVEIACFFIGVAIVLLGRIWYDRRENISGIQFFMTCMILCVLLTNAMVSGEPFSAFVLGVTGVLMLVIAAILNNKKYVVAASITLSLMALYLTRDFWLSIAWWVYLFVAGVVLVVLAARKEGKQK